ncbi:MAG TPA: glutamate synthase [Desulfomicrobium sp.]|nr:glutamate synthase [Desulfomicrobium sp.]
MCRLFALTSSDPVSPMDAIRALDVMREGHDGSGVGLYLSDLAGPFESMKDSPVLSGIFTDLGMKRLDEFMEAKGFTLRYDMPITPKGPLPTWTPRRDRYVVRAYDIPASWKDLNDTEKGQGYLKTRLELKHMGLQDESMTVFSFWPDTVMIKEIGDPLQVGEYLGLDRPEIMSRLVLAQGRQNTNYAINLYACHPFFIEGLSTMTNGENTAFVPIRDYLMGQGVPGYEGYNSDSEVFTHILHYTVRRLGLPFEAYKHIITPLKDHEMKGHPDQAFLSKLKQICRRLIIDGPNCVIGCLPDKSMFMVQDSKKLRPGVVGGRPGFYAFSSEICGLDLAIPDRDKSQDFQPMHLDSAIVGPDRQEVRVCRQSQPLPLPN